MANANQVKALISSHAAGDEERFYSVALQVAAHAARSGHANLANELREMVDQSRRAVARSNGPKLRPTPLVQPRGDLAELLAAEFPDARLSDLVLADKVENQLQRILLEHRQQDQLVAHGFKPIRRALFVGPPGTGKTLSARAIAGELKLPLFVIRLDGLITKFMGETAAKMRLVFEAMTQTHGVYFFDEVDALAGERDSENDVGEIRRVLNSFLQFLEAEYDGSILIAATNHPHLLDRAMFRRFEAVVEYPLPTKAISREVIKLRLASANTKDVAWTRIDKCTGGLSQAELTLAAESAAKDSILHGEPNVTTDRLVHALRGVAGRKR